MYDHDEPPIEPCDAAIDGKPHDAHYWSRGECPGYDGPDVEPPPQLHLVTD